MNSQIKPGTPAFALLAEADPRLPVFERLGTIVRALHDALSELGTQNILTDAATEFPSARDRLVHIARLTENAANIVLSKVEETGPLLDQLGSRAATLEAAWNDPAQGVPGTPAQVALAASTVQFLGQVQGGCTTTRTALSDIMMAQDFQDLTGQLIKKVVALIERTENDLLNLLIDAAPAGTVGAAQRDDLLAGPGTPGGVALDQESVDDLLADLGF